MNSTTVKAEDLNMGPYGGLSQDDDEGDNNDFADATEDHILPPLGTQSAYSVYWEVTYSLSTRGEVRAESNYLIFT